MKIPTKEEATAQALARLKKMLENNESLAKLVNEDTKGKK